VQAFCKRRASTVALAPGQLLRTPLHPTLASVREILDPTGRHVSLGRTTDWQKRTRRELAASLAGRVTALSGIDLRLLDLVPLIRNAIAHRSPDSSTRMNAALRSVEAALKRRQREISISGIGAYLHARSSGGVRRVAITTPAYEM
jgi:hypothetical protein